MRICLRISAIGVAAVLCFAFLQHCKHDPMTSPVSLKKWSDIPIKAIFEVPSIAGRNEEGDVSLELFSDNSLTYTFHIHNLAQTDQLTAAHIHAGNAGTNGSVFIDFHPTFLGAGATGIITGLRDSQVDSLLHVPCYFNVHSSQAQSGIVRGQLDKQVTFAKDILLTGDKEAPTPVTTTATGLAILRLTDTVLYSRVLVANIETNDTFTVSHIHRGAEGVAGPIRILLVQDTADFNKLKIINLHDSLVSILKNDPVYVNVHSRRHAPGIIRGQIR